MPLQLLNHMLFPRRIPCEDSAACVEKMCRPRSRTQQTPAQHLTLSVVLFNVSQTLCQPPCSSDTSNDVAPDMPVTLTTKQNRPVLTNRHLHRSHVRSLPVMQACRLHLEEPACPLPLGPYAQQFWGLRLVSLIGFLHTCAMLA